MKLFKAELYSDERGDIFNGMPNNEIIANEPVIRNVMYITGKKGAQRGNHVHSKDSHFAMVVDGILKYEWTNINSNEVKSIILTKGDVVYSQPGEKHRFIFETDGAFVAMATQPRTQELYEKDTLRVEF